MEILTNAIYRGTNLRIQLEQNNNKKCVIFHPRVLKTVIISSVIHENDQTSANSDASMQENNLILKPRFIVIGPITDYLLIRGVKNAKISAICNRIYVDDCTNIILFVNTSNSVLLARNCRLIRLAPYNIFYDVII